MTLPNQDFVVTILDQPIVTTPQGATPALPTIGIDTLVGIPGIQGPQGPPGSGGGQNVAVVNDANYAMANTDNNVVYKAITAARSVTLPLAANSRYARIGVAEGVAATGLNTVSVITQGSDVLNAPSATAASAPGQSTVYLSDGVSNWYAWADLSIQGGTLTGYVQMDGMRPGFRGSFNSNMTVADTDQQIVFLSNSGGLSVALQSALSHAQELWVSDGNGGAGVHPISITPNGSDTINGVNAAIQLKTAFGIMVIRPAGNGAWNAFEIGPNAVAPLASPPFTGTPTAPTQSAGDNSTKLATTAYCDLTTIIKQTLTGTTVQLTSAQCIRSAAYFTCTTATIVKLAAHLAGQAMSLTNLAASTTNVTVQDSTGATITNMPVLAPGMTVVVIDDGTTWQVH